MIAERFPAKSQGGSREGGERAIPPLISVGTVLGVIFLTTAQIPLLSSFSFLFLKV